MTSCWAQSQQLVTWVDESWEAPRGAQAAEAAEVEGTRFVLLHRELLWRSNEAQMSTLQVQLICPSPID